jgi:hypothetical protein
MGTLSATDASAAFASQLRRTLGASTQGTDPDAGIGPPFKHRSHHFLSFPSLFTMRIRLIARGAVHARRAYFPIIGARLASRKQTYLVPVCRVDHGLVNARSMASLSLSVMVKII